MAKAGVGDAREGEPVAATALTATARAATARTAVSTATQRWRAERARVRAGPQDKAGGRFQVAVLPATTAAGPEVAPLVAAALRQDLRAPVPTGVV